MVDDAEMPAEQRQHFLGIVVAETERLSRLVNQVLDMAKIESGHAEWHNSDIDLHALLSQAVQTTSRCSRTRYSVELQMQTRRRCAHTDRLMQVMLNLLSSAASSCRAKGGAGGCKAKCRLTWPDDNGGIVPRRVLRECSAKVVAGSTTSTKLGDQPADRGTLRRAHVARA
jgi:nitrogen fixation/metabolism regulation signal transduction histidine kinase